MWWKVLLLILASLDTLYSYSPGRNFILHSFSKHFNSNQYKYQTTNHQTCLHIQNIKCNNYASSTHLTNKLIQALASISHQPHQPHQTEHQYNITTITSLKNANDAIYRSKITILSNIKICLHNQEHLAKNLPTIAQSQSAWPTTKSRSMDDKNVYNPDDDLAQFTDDKCIIDETSKSQVFDNTYLNITNRTNNTFDNLCNTYPPITITSNHEAVNQQEHHYRTISITVSSILTGYEKSKSSDLCLTDTKKILYQQAIRISADIKETRLKKIQKVNGAPDLILGNNTLQYDYVYGEDNEKEKRFVDRAVKASKNIFRGIVYIVCGFIFSFVLSPRYSINIYLLALFFTIAETQNFDCFGDYSCENKIINCNTTHEVDCVVNCGNETEPISACYRATINGGAGNLLINGTGDSCMSAIVINCPVNRYCNITCYGGDGCYFANILAKSGTKLNIDASGYKVLKDASITCPPDAVRGGYDGKTNQCNIVVHDGDRMMNYLQIYAVESFHDVNIVCDNILFGCFEDQPAIRPKIHCTENFGSDCEFSFDINGTNWKCINPPDSICNGYLLKTPTPSANPTMEPTTFEPTFSPTRYDPNDSPHTILYVSESRGCDYGYCEDEKVDYNEYCMQPWFLSYA
eukprot:133907_1